MAPPRWLTLQQSKFQRRGDPSCLAGSSRSKVLAVPALDNVVLFGRLETILDGLAPPLAAEEDQPPHYVATMPRTAHAPYANVCDVAGWTVRCGSMRRGRVFAAAAPRGVGRGGGDEFFAALEPETDLVGVSVSSTNASKVLGNVNTINTQYHEQETQNLDPETSRVPSHSTCSTVIRDRRLVVTPDMEVSSLGSDNRTCGPSVSPDHEAEVELRPSSAQPRPSSRLEELVLPEEDANVDESLPQTLQDEEDRWDRLFADVKEESQSYQSASDRAGLRTTLWLMLDEGLRPPARDVVEVLELLGEGMEVEGGRRAGVLAALEYVPAGALSHDSVVALFEHAAGDQEFLRGLMRSVQSVMPLTAAMSLPVLHTFAAQSASDVAAIFREIVYKRTVQLSETLLLDLVTRYRNNPLVEECVKYNRRTYGALSLSMYHALIDYYSEQQMEEKLCDLFEWMQRDGVTLEHSAYRLFVDAAIRSGRRDLLGRMLQASGNHDLASIVAEFRRGQAPTPAGALPQRQSQLSARCARAERVSPRLVTTPSPQQQSTLGKSLEDKDLVAEGAPRMTRRMTSMTFSPSLSSLSSQSPTTTSSPTSSRTYNTQRSKKPLEFFPCTKEEAQESEASRICSVSAEEQPKRRIELKALDLPEVQRKPRCVVVSAMRPLVPELPRMPKTRFAQRPLTSPARFGTRVVAPTANSTMRLDSGVNTFRYQVSQAKKPRPPAPAPRMRAHKRSSESSTPQPGTYSTPTPEVIVNSEEKRLKSRPSSTKQSRSTTPIPTSPSGRQSPSSAGGRASRPTSRNAARRPASPEQAKDSDDEAFGEDGFASGSGRFFGRCGSLVEDLTAGLMQVMNSRSPSDSPSKASRRISKASRASRASASRQIGTPRSSSSEDSSVHYANVSEDEF